MKVHIPVFSRIFLLVFWLTFSVGWAQQAGWRVWREPGKLLSAAECMAIDSRGLIWVGAQNGLAAMDGYGCQWLRNSLTTPSLLPQDEVLSVVEGSDGCIWFGAGDVLCRLDRRTGSIVTHQMEGQGTKRIYSLYRARDGRVWVGYEGGLAVVECGESLHASRFTLHAYSGESLHASRFTLHVYSGESLHASRFTLHVYSGESLHASRFTLHASRFTLHVYSGELSVKDIIETERGDLIVATWSSGLWRFSPTTGKMQQYQNVDASMHLYALCLDRRGRLWIGTWDDGLWRMDKPDDMNAVVTRMKSRDELMEIHDMKAQGAIICGAARDGLFLIDDATGNLDVDEGVKDVASFAGTLQIEADGMGGWWLCNMYEGLLHISPTANDVFLFHVTKQEDKRGPMAVNTLFAENERTLWMGLNNYRLAVEGQTAYGLDPLMTPANCITRRKDGEIWVGCNGHGVMAHRRGEQPTHYSAENCAFLSSNFVHALLTDKAGTTWMGADNGLTAVPAKNIDKAQKVLTSNVQGIALGNGVVWAATENDGIYGIEGNVMQPNALHVRHYSLDDGTLPVRDVQACHVDKQGRVWAISHSGGLLLYNKEKDEWTPVNDLYHIAAEKIAAINEDEEGRIWLATSGGLVRLTLNDKPVVATFGWNDGIEQCTFMDNATARLGNTLYFGMANGWLSFDAGQTPIGNSVEQHLLLTDILLDDVAYDRWDADLRAEVSALIPAYTEAVTIPAGTRKFEFAFALMTPRRGDQTVYAYWLEGNDSDWTYVSGEKRSATFKNVAPGTYQFHLKARDYLGTWHALPYSITVVVKAPWWNTLWAKMGYVLIGIALLLLAVRLYRQYKQKHRHPAPKFRDLSDIPVADVEIVDADTEFLRQAVECVNRHISDADFNRDTFAKEMALSPSTLFRRIKELTGQNVSAFISQIRLKAALNIAMNNPAVRVSDVAYQVGFSSPRYFSLCFKKEYGKLLHDYVKEQKEQQQLNHNNE